MRFAARLDKIRLTCFGRSRGLLEALDDFAGDVAGHWGTAAVYILNGAEQFVWRRRFEQVTGGAVGQGLEDLFCVFVNGEHDDLAGRFGDFEFAHAIDSAHAGEIDVHQDDFRLFLWNFGESIFPGRVGA